MVLFLCLSLIASVGLSGANNLWTVKRLSVKKGDNITIPCLYHEKYIDNVKYWCKGSAWTYCTILTRTDVQQTGEERVSMTHDMRRRVITLTINNVQFHDEDMYWCAVEIGGFFVIDDGVPLYLVVTSGDALLSVQESHVTCDKQQSVTVRCQYSSSYKSMVKKWCRLQEKTTCVSVGQEETTHFPAQVQDDNKNAFTVKMMVHNDEHAGWYWCSAGDLQIPVHVWTLTHPRYGTEHNIHNRERNVSILVIAVIALLLLLAAVACAWLTLRREHKKPSANQQGDDSGGTKVTRATVNTTEGTKDEVTYLSVMSSKRTSTDTYETDPASTVIYSVVAPYNTEDPPLLLKL